jgi:hypothetical protein
MPRSINGNTIYTRREASLLACFTQLCAFTGSKTDKGILATFNFHYYKITRGIPRKDIELAKALMLIAREHLPPLPP